MADVAEEGEVIAACSSLLVAASFGAATVVSVVVNIPRDIKVGLMYITNDRQLFGFWTDDMT